jgi:hypothetical protein
LAEPLLSKGDIVHGVKRRSSSLNNDAGSIIVDPHTADTRFFCDRGRCHSSRWPSPESERASRTDLARRARASAERFLGILTAEAAPED